MVACNALKRYINKTEKPFSLQDDERNDMNDKNLLLFHVPTISTFFLVQCKLFKDHFTCQFLLAKRFDCFGHLDKQPGRREKVIPRAATDYILQLKNTWYCYMTN